jgi:RimK family alpha-L-glutamate ligase
MKTFNELVTEEKVDNINKEPYRLVVLTEKPKKENPKSTSAKLIRTAEQLKIKTYDCRLNGAFLMRDQDSGEITIHREGDLKGFEIDADTIVIVRGNVTRKDSYMDLISQIERYGIPICNFRECIEVCSDKFRSYLRLQEIGMTQPKTILVPNDDLETVQFASEALEDEFPMVMKTLQGSRGVGVLLVETERSLHSQVQLLYKIDPFCDILLQEYIEADYDVRAIICNRQIVGAMKRNKVIDDFRANASQGSKVESFVLTEKEKDVCLQAAKGVNGQWVGVDFFPADDRKNGEPIIIEINHSPGTAAISKAIGENVGKLVLKELFDRNIWKKSASECGVLETIEVEGEEMTAKFDTGNNTTVCSLHIDDDYKIKGKKVHWESNGVKYSKPLVREVKLKKPDETRPVVMLEVNFLNTVYEQEVSLDKRNYIPFLVNRDFMKRANLMVNPSRKFMLTNIRNDSSDEKDKED